MTLKVAGHQLEQPKNIQFEPIIEILDNDILIGNKYKPVSFAKDSIAKEKKGKQYLEKKCKWGGRRVRLIK